MGPPEARGCRSRRTSTDRQPSHDTPDQICVKTEYGWVFVTYSAKRASMAQGRF